MPSDEIEKEERLYDRQVSINGEQNEKVRGIFRPYQKHQMTVYQQGNKETDKRTVEALLQPARDKNIKGCRVERERKIDWISETISQKHLLGLSPVCVAACGALLRKGTPIRSCCLIYPTRSSFLWRANSSIAGAKSCSLVFKNTPLFRVNRNVYHTTRRLNSTEQLVEQYKEREATHSSFPFSMIAIGLGVSGIASRIALGGKVEGEEKEAEKNLMDRKETDQEFSCSKPIKSRLFSLVVQAEQKPAIGLKSYWGYTKILDDLLANDSKVGVINLRQKKLDIEMLRALKQAIANNFIVEWIHWGAIPMDSDCQNLKKEIEDKLKENRRNSYTYKEALEKLSTNDPKKKRIDLRRERLTKKQLKEFKKVIDNNVVVEYIQWGQILAGSEWQALKKEIENRLKENSCNCYTAYEEALKNLSINDPKKKRIDLRGNSLSKEQLEDLKKAIDNNDIVECIHWGDIPADSDCRDLKKKIENKLKENSYSYHSCDEALEGLQGHGPKKKRIDLRHEELTKEKLEKLKQAIKNNSPIDYIYWRNVPPECQKLKREIEDKLIDNYSYHSCDEALEALQGHGPKKKRIDLRHEELTKEKLEKLKQAIKNNFPIDYIYWENVPPECQELKNRIEGKLAKKVCEYTYNPNDYIHGLLVMHAYNNPEKDQEVDFDALAQRLKHVLPPNINTKWKVVKIGDNVKLPGVLYVNEDAQQVVLVFKGTDLESIPNDKEGTDSDSLLNKVEKLVSSVKEQQSLAYETTKVAVEYAKKIGFNLSIAGHAFGGHLTELGVAHCHFDFGCKTVRGIVFDSPGLDENIRDFASNIRNKDPRLSVTDLPITTYLSAPNLINTCNKYKGEVYRVCPDLKLTDWAEEWLERGSKLVNNGDEMNDIYKNLVITTSRSLELMMDLFDPATGKPREYVRVADWPQLNTDKAKQEADEKRRATEMKVEFSSLLGSILGGSLGARLGAKTGVGEDTWVNRLIQKTDSLVYSFTGKSLGYNTHVGGMAKIRRIIVYGAVFGIGGHSMLSKGVLLVAPWLGTFVINNLDTAKKIDILLRDYLAFKSDMKEYCSRLESLDNDYKKSDLEVKEQFDHRYKKSPIKINEHVLGMNGYEDIDNHLHELWKNRKNIAQLPASDVVTKILTDILAHYEIVIIGGVRYIRLNSSIAIEELRDKMKRALDVLPSSTMRCFTGVLKICTETENLQLDTPALPFSYQFNKANWDEKKDTEHMIKALQEQLSTAESVVKEVQHIPLETEVRKSLVTVLGQKSKQLNIQLKIYKNWADVSAKFMEKDLTLEADNKLDSLITALKDPFLNLADLNKRSLLNRAYNIKAKIAVRNGNTELAEDYYKEATESLPDDVITWSNYSGLLNDRGRWEENGGLHIRAYDYYNKKVYPFVDQLSSKQQPVVYSGIAYGFILLAKNIEQKQVDPKQVAKILEVQVAEIPRVEELRMKAQGLLEHAIQAAPTYVNAHLFLAVLRYDNGEYETALQEVKKVLAINPTHQTGLMRKGYILEKLENPTKAMKCLEKSLELLQKNPKRNSGWIKEINNKIAEIKARK